MICKNNLRYKTVKKLYKYEAIGQRKFTSFRNKYKRDSAQRTHCTTGLGDFLSLLSHFKP